MCFYERFRQALADRANAWLSLSCVSHAPSGFAARRAVLLRYVDKNRLIASTRTQATCLIGAFFSKNCSFSVDP